MKRLIFVLSLLFLSSIIYSQTMEWVWANQVGNNTTYDEGHAIATDNDGNSYVTGYFSGYVNFGATSLNANGTTDIFVAKLDAHGNWLWARKAGGPQDDTGNGIAVDEYGNCYVTGNIRGVAIFGVIQISCQGTQDMFVAKLDTNGNWQCVQQAYGTGSKSGLCISLDPSGNSYVSGRYTGNAVFGSDTLHGFTFELIFIAKLDVNGNWLWVIQPETNNNSHLYAISTDLAGNNYVTGDFSASATFGSTVLTSNGVDMFIAKLNSNGDWLWAKKTGGGGKGYGVSVDAAANCYVTGDFTGTVNFGSTSLTAIAGASNMFVTMLDTNGNWIWAVKAGGANLCTGTSIASDPLGNSYITGRYTGNVTFGTYSISGGISSYNAFIAKVDSCGNWNWVDQAGGAGNTFSNSIAIGTAGNCVITGSNEGVSSFDDISIPGNAYPDIFVAMYGYLPPIPLYSADVLSGYAPLSVHFSDNTIVGSKTIVSRNWSFGDGGTSTVQNPDHIYTNPGVYTVSLSVTDESNLTYTYTRQNYITAILFASEITLQSNQSIDFGSQNIPVQSEYHPVKFSNTGGLDLIISDIHFISVTSCFEFIHPNPSMVISPGVQDTIFVRFVPQTLGACTDTLFIENNSINLPILKISLSGIGLQVPPLPPENVAIIMDGSNAVISWDAVTETVLHTPLIPDYYLVFDNGSGDLDDDYYYLGWTEGLSYTHQRVGLHAQNMFYRVLAYEYYGRGWDDIADLGLMPGMKEDEVLLRLQQ